MSEQNDPSALTKLDYSDPQILDELRSLNLDELAKKLNEAGCNDYSEHPLKTAIGIIIDERYPQSDGWEVFSGNNGYTDPWIRTKDDVQVGIDCRQDGDEYVWIGYSEEKSNRGGRRHDTFRDTDNVVVDPYKQAGIHTQIVNIRLNNVLNNQSAEKEKGLSEAQKEIIINTLRNRFLKLFNSDKNDEWGRIKSVIESSPEILVNVNKMEENGHEPAVYNIDEEGFDIGSSCAELQDVSGFVIYDDRAEKFLQQNKYRTHRIGNAVDLAHEMGAEVMSEEQYKALQQLGEFDMKSNCFLKISDDESKQFQAKVANRRKTAWGDHRLTIGYFGLTYQTRSNKGFRASIRVSW